MTSSAKERVLAFVAHPDDEVLGAGGTLARHAAAGDDVWLAFLTDGVGARGVDDAAAQRRKAAARLAAGVLGARDPVFLEFPDNRLDAVDLLSVTQAAEAVLREIDPAVVYTHHGSDLNIDHAICHRAVLTACRPVPAARVRRLYAMEVVSSTEWATPTSANAFIPTRFVDISATIDMKRRALQAYSEELRPFPHSRSADAIEALAIWRGASAGLAAAEAFVVLRDIDR